MHKRFSLRFLIRYLARSSKNSEALARGIAVGLFVGFLPLIGLQGALAFFTAGLVNGNRIIAVLGTFVTNPFTTIPVSAFAIWLGDLILPGSSLNGISLNELDLSTLMKLPSNFLLGSLVIAINASFLGYCGVKSYMKFKKGNC